jgi:hypothetical protein
MAVGAPTVLSFLGERCATDGKTARRHGVGDELTRLLGRGNPWRVKPKGVSGVEQTRKAEGGENREEGEKP